MTASVDPSPGGRLHGISVRTAGLARPLAGTRWFRLWAVLHHVGRRSGCAYSIPVVALPVAGGFVIPLPFGDATQWLKNIREADQAGLRRAGHDYVIDRPELVDLDVVADELPAPIRFASRRLGLHSFVRVRQVSRG